MEKNTAVYHLPGLFEFYELYRRFLPLFREHREYFYPWCDIGSIYGAPEGSLWGGGRLECGSQRAEDVLALLRDYGISARLTFSNSLLEEKHLKDPYCNALCGLLEKSPIPNGVIVHSELLTEYLQKRYPGLYLVSSTTKVLTDFSDLERELRREEFAYVVPDFRLNPEREKLSGLEERLKAKVELLCNECCDFACRQRKRCYEEVSRKSLGRAETGFRCASPEAARGYRFSATMKNPGFIGVQAIREAYLPMGLSNFKIEGRGLGSALVLEFLLYYLTLPEAQLRVREEIYLDNTLDLF